MNCTLCNKKLHRRTRVRINAIQDGRVFAHFFVCPDCATFYYIVGELSKEIPEKLIVGFFKSIMRNKK